MTTPTLVWPPSIPDPRWSASPNGYQAVVLTVTIRNPSSTSSYDVSNGLTIVVPVDPGGSGSPAALLLSSASGNGGGTAQPTLTVPITNVVMPPGWEYVVPVPGTYRALPPGDSAVLAANGSLQFAFSPVVADFASGSANITVSVPSATTTGTALTLTVPIIKLPAPLSATLNASTPALTMPDNTTNLSWQVLGADTCELTWAPSTTVVTYNGEPCPNPWSDPPFQFSEGASLPVVTVYQNTSFTLTANGQSKEDAATAEVTLATPTLIALTIPPLVTGVSPASGDPGGGQQVTITGTGLYGTSTIVSVTFDDASATVLTVDAQGGSITATTPPGTAGTNVPVTVITQTGASVATPAASYTYAPAGVPVVTGIDPPGGDPAGGQQVTIAGTGLAGATAVTFGSASATPFTVNADGSVTATVPPVTLSAGTKTSVAAVTVTTPAGSSPPTPAASYTYAATGVPVVCGVTQDGAGSPYGGQQVTITGINFSGATSVAFGSAGLTLTDNNPDLDGTTITVTAPAADPSDISHGTPCTTIDVTVTVAGDTTSPLTSATNAADKYTYANTPPSPPAPPDQPSSPSVSPCQPFNLIWSCYNNTTLNWSMIQAAPGVTDTVTVTGLASGSVSNGGKIMPSDTAVVTITAPTTFTLQVAPPGVLVPAPASLGVDAVALSDFSYGVPVVDPTDGNQSVSLTWTAQNASSFSLTGGEVNEPDLPYDQRSYLVTSLSLSAPTEFTLTAIGFDDSGAYAPIIQTVTVVPRAVEVIITTSPVQAQVSNPAQGTQTAIVEWEAQNAIWVAITGGAQTLYPGIHDTSTTVELPVPPPSSGPASYLITIQAGGYVAPDVPDSGTVTVIPTAVAITSFTASPGQDYRYPNHPGEPVALNWAVTAATGLILSINEVAPPLPPETTAPTYNPGPESTATYTLTAQGYPGVAQLPSKSVTVYVHPLKVPGTKETGGQLEKNPPDYPKQRPRPAPYRDRVTWLIRDPAPSGGTEQAFIGPDERPDVRAPGAQGPHVPAAGEESGGNP